MGEPWPVCSGPHDDSWDLHEPGSPPRTEPGLLGARPDLAAANPLVPVAQLWRRDLPGWAGPAEADLLQVLWCPLDHEDLGYLPRVELRWRQAAALGALRDEPPPGPVLVRDDYLPAGCVLHPEQVTEYPERHALPPELADALDEVDYERDLSLAPGWKLGGYPSWRLTDPYAMTCGVCGAASTFLMCVAGAEWDGADSSWRPPGAVVANPTGITIGRGYDLWIFMCPVSPQHPPGLTQQ